ncbi:MAG: hypothetical protein A3G87_09005 [Omnitrophica bacterium RIFCSPLOWO2_12_FULL_50_11]|nr:MAG: hypothetical protein A3G87_09005 [Omnitrophica bacterium RIFCSPLOWO2_12_FULL_50_11]
MGGRYPIRQLPLQPEATGASARAIKQMKPPVEKRSQKAISERTGRNISKRRASLEKGNVTAELVRNMRRPKPTRERAGSEVWGHRGIGDSMCAKGSEVNTGSPKRG